ncbi:MAG TPA: class I SAM-dependent methyltransferase [Jatrophihabitans sp.]
MTEMIGYYDHLDFNSPLSGTRADALAAALARRGPVTVLDIGCGWAELLLRVLAAAPDARGLGVDSDEKLIVRGRDNAVRRGLADRVELRAGEGSAPLEPADAVLCIGADHVWGDQASALAALHPLVRPGGVLLIGTGYWQRPPTVAQAAGLGATPDELPDLATLVDWSTAAGFRPVDIQTANEDEWNAFESGYLADLEEYVMTHPSATAQREQADRHRAGWLRGYRGVLGFAYLTLGVPSLR